LISLEKKIELAWQYNVPACTITSTVDEALDILYNKLLTDEDVSENVFDAYYNLAKLIINYFS